MDKNKIHILVVDDDDRIRELIKQYLKDNNFIVSTALDAENAKLKISQFKFDLIVLDVMMPGQSGFDLTKEIKKKMQIPIILLTAKGEVENRIKGLELGADDYLAKPFEPEELYLRIKNLLNFYQNSSNKQIKVSFGDFIFDMSSLTLKQKNNIVYLTEAENDLLLKLIYKRSNIVLREELAEQEFDESELRKIDVRITRLRQKIEKNPKQPQYIKTVRGKGYKLVCDEL